MGLAFFWPIHQDSHSVLRPLHRSFKTNRVSAGALNENLQSHGEAGHHVGDIYLRPDTGPVKAIHFPSHFDPEPLPGGQNGMGS